MSSEAFLYFLYFTAKLRSHLAGQIVSTLRRLVSANGRLVSDYQLVNWLKAVKFLDALDEPLEDLIAVAIGAYKYQYLL